MQAGPAGAQEPGAGIQDGARGGAGRGAALAAAVLASWVASLRGGVWPVCVAGGGADAIAPLTAAATTQAQRQGDFLQREAAFALQRRRKIAAAKSAQEQDEASVTKQGPYASGAKETISTRQASKFVQRQQAWAAKKERRARHAARRHDEQELAALRDRPLVNDTRCARHAPP